MKKNLAKIICAVLLLSLVASVFAVLPAFAEEGATELKPTVFYDMDAKTSLTMVNVACLSCGAADSKCKCNNKVLSSLAATKVSDETDGVYWEIGHNEAAGTKVGAGAYIKEGSLGTPSNVVVKSGAVNSKGVEIGDKNTDFMVIDLDVSADGAMLPKLQFHMRYGNSTGGTSQDPNGYPTIQGSSIDTLYISQSEEPTVASVPTVAREGEWVNITFVYDFRGEDSAKWKGYAYIDGYYVATFESATKSDAYYFQWLRLSFASTAAQANESVKMRNLTYKTYPVGWNGDMADSAALGQYGNTLYDIDELAYCFEGNNPSAISETPIASIARVGVEDPILVYSLDELDAKFVEGDVVTLNKSIATPIFVNAANVTFTENEYTYNLVDTSSIADLSAIKYVVLDAKTREVVASGDAAAFKEQALLAGDNIYIMLSDLTYTRVNSSDGTNAYGRNSVIDTNGYTLTFASSKRTFNTASGSDGVIRINGGGKVIFKGTTDLTMINRNNAVIFENLELIDVVTITLIDQRHGLAMFKNIGEINCADYTTEEGTFTKTLVSIKGYGGRTSGVIFDNVNMETTKSALPISNVSSGGYRYGSITAKVRINDSNIKVVDGPLLISEIYANQYDVTIDADGVVTVPDGVIGANQNKVELDITGSYIDVYSRVIDVELESLSCNVAKNTEGEKVTLTGEQIVKADGMSADFDININGSNVKCASVVMQYNATSLDSEDVDYSYTVDVNVDGTSAIDASLGLFYQRCNDPEAVVATLTLADGVKLMNDLITRAGNPAINLMLAEGSVIAGTSLGGEYPFVVTPYHTEYNYTSASGANGSFVWADGEDEKVNASTFAPLPETTNLYTYRWEINDSGAYKAVVIPAFPLKVNLTLSETIAINVFIPTTVVEVTATGITVGGVAITEAETTTIDNVDYFKITVPGITPKNANKTHKITINIKDAFGNDASFTKSISVIDYLANVHAQATAESETSTIEFMNRIFTYIVKAAAYDDSTSNITAPEGSGLEIKTYENMTYPEGNVVGLTVALNLEDGYRWIVSGLEAGTAYEVKYYVNGTEVTKNITADGNGIITIVIKACDLLDYSVTVDGRSFTFEKYAVGITDEKTKALIDAIYYYAEAAKNN